MNSEVAEAPEHVFDPYFLRDVKQGQKPSSFWL